MIDNIFYFITVPMVYLAIAWCIVGILAKIVSLLKKPAHPHTLKVFEKDDKKKSPLVDAFLMPSIRRYKPVLWFFLLVFHGALAVLLLAHIDLFEGVNIMPEESPHMIGAGAVGLILTISILYLLFRRFRSPVREVSVPADYLLLFFIFMIFLTGDIISWGNSWSPDGFVIEKADFKAYFASLVNFTFENPSEMLYGSHYVVVVVHVLLANLFFMFLPFSKIMHTFFAVPINRLRRG